MAVTANIIRINKKVGDTVFGNSNKNRERKNLILPIFCILLFALFVVLMLWSRREDAADAKRLANLAAKQGELQGSEAEGQKNPNHTDTAEEENQTPEDAEKVEPTEPADENTTDAADEKENLEEENQEAAGIVCWGDDLINGDEAATYSYPAVLDNLLKEKGYELPVINKTLQGAGTLSMMTMAGVPENEVQNYVTAHQTAAQGAEIPITETGIRDLTPEQTERNDLDCIPIIFMGYYGGWNHDPVELAQQQEKILNTFPNQEKFLIAGTFPLDGSVDSATLDNVLSQKWGEHYISMASVTTNPAASYDGQADLAAAIVAKLEELGYIFK